jgi:hypothetical protein
MVRGLILSMLLLMTPARAQQDPNYLVSAKYVLPRCVMGAEHASAEDWFRNGFCNGIVHTIFREGIQLGVCVPDGVTLAQGKRVVVRYVSARPQRMDEYFEDLAIEAIRDAWPCKRKHRPGHRHRHQGHPHPTSLPPTWSR